MCSLPRCIWTLLCAAVLAGFSPAQSVLVDEDFNAAVFPPSDWQHWNRGATPGWDWDPSGRARHLDWFGFSDADLVTPVLDSSGLSQLTLHAVHGQLFSSYREINEIRVTLDGGLTSEWVHTVTAPKDGSSLPLEIDLSAYAGIAGFQVIFHYQGDFANEWTLDTVTIDNLPPLIPPYWPKLPTTFRSAEGFHLRFDELQGVVPTWLGVNSVDEFTRVVDAEGWCNLGQLGPSQRAWSGTTSLEMGLDPQASTFHDVANALVIGLDGRNMSQAAVEFMAYQINEEANADDGIFVSDDGVAWYPVRQNWELQTGGPEYAESWRKISCFFDRTPADLSGDFFLAIAQADDFPYGNNDGVAIDDIRIGSGVEPFHLEIPPVIAGQLAQVQVQGADPSRLVTVLYSFTDAGPTTTSWGMAQIGKPFFALGTRDPDSAGQVMFQVAVPANVAGMMIWAQAVEFVDLEGRFSNPVSFVVQ